MGEQRIAWGTQFVDEKVHKYVNRRIRNRNIRNENHTSILGVIKVHSVALELMSNSFIVGGCYAVALRATYLCLIAPN